MSRIKGHWLMLAACFFFCLFTTWQLLSAKPDPQQERVAETITALKVGSPQSIETLQKQPLFNKDRKPLFAQSEDIISDEMHDQLPAELPAPAPKPSTAAPTLVGLASGRKKAVAIVKGQNGSAKNLSPGESIDGWRLLAVNRSSATFINAGIKETIKLDYSNKALGGPADQKLPAQSNLDDLPPDVSQDDLDAFREGNR